MNEKKKHKSSWFIYNNQTFNLIEMINCKSESGVRIKLNGIPYTYLIIPNDLPKYKKSKIVHKLLKNKQLKTLEGKKVTW